MRRALAGRRFGSELAVLAETGSTNADLAEAAAAGAPDGAVIVAEHQTAGRGRAGRTWESRPGLAVQLSALVRPAPGNTLLPLIAGLAAAEAVESVASRVRASLKWPNDVMVGAAKLAGVLVEAHVQGGRRGWAVIGIGINVEQAAGELPEGATSLALSGESDIDRGRIVVALLVALEDRLAEPGEVVLSAYRQRCATLGQEVRVERPNGALSGTALDLAPTGALLVATATGVEEVSFGDVVHLRTAGGGRA